MIRKTLFNNWAGEYEDSIDSLSNGYPFEGYYNVLECINESVSMRESTKILDIGIGTGLLTNELYKKGAEIFGIDFSENMISIAQNKMPNAKLFCADFSDKLPDEILLNKFDYIVSSYAFHHLNDIDKINFIISLKSLLKDGGKILIGDISFDTLENMERCKKISIDDWDQTEFYFAYDTISKSLKELNFENTYLQISSCAGVLEVK